MLCVVWPSNFDRLNLWLMGSWTRAKWNTASLLFRGNFHLLNKTHVIDFAVVDSSCDLVKAIIMKPPSWVEFLVLFRDDLLSCAARRAHPSECNNSGTNRIRCQLHVCAEFRYLTWYRYCGGFQFQHILTIHNMHHVSNGSTGNTTNMVWVKV